VQVVSVAAAAAASADPSFVGATTWALRCVTVHSQNLGAVDVRVTSVSAGEGPWLPDGYAYTRTGPYTMPPPNVTSVEPTWGWITGDTVVTLRGTNLGVSSTDVEEVTLAGVPCVRGSISWRSSSMLVCVTNSTAAPARGEATYVPLPPLERIVVHTGKGGASLRDQGEIFWYRWPRPTVTRVRPRVSLNAGEARITLAGSWYLGGDSPVAPRAYIHGQPCLSTEWASPTTVVCVTPPVSVIQDRDALADRKLTFAVEIEGQRSAPLLTRFRYGIECSPPCGWDAECDVILGPDGTEVADSDPVCSCHRTWSGPPMCEQSVMAISNATARVTDEDGGQALFELRVLEGPHGAAPTADVTMRVTCTDPTEEMFVDGSVDRDYTFTASNWNVPQTITVVGRPDPAGPQRDGDVATGLMITRVSSQDPQYDSALVPLYPLINRDAAPVILEVSTLISSTAGSNVTLTVANLDPFVRVELVAEDTGTVIETLVHTVEDIHGAVIANMTAARLALDAVAAVAIGSGSGIAAAATRASSSSPTVVAFPPPSHNISRQWRTVVLTTPAGLAPKSYHRIRLTNLGTPAAPASSRASATYAGGSMYYTDRCPEVGSFGIATAAGAAVGEFGSCRPCPEGGECPGGERVWPKPGYWNPGEASGYVVKCRVEEACVGGRHLGEMCAVGYEGRLCGTCSPGYYTEQSTGRCLACPEPEGIAAYVLCDAILWLTIAAAGLFLRDYENFSHVIGFVMALQSLGGMGKVIGDTGSESANTVYAILHLFSGEYSFLKPNCIDPVPYHLQFATQLAYNVAIGVPMIGGMFLVKYVGVRRARKFGPETVDQRRRFYRARHIRCVTAWLTLNYLSVAMLAVRSVLCRRFGGEGTGTSAEWFLWADPSYECFTPIHYALVGASAILMLGYTLGYPIMYTRWITTHKDKRFIDLTFQEAWNFCYEPFKPAYWGFFWMEFFISCVIAIGDTLLRQHPKFQNLIVGGVLVFNLLLLLIVRPFHRAWENTIIAVLTFCNILALVLSHVRENAPESIPEAAVSGMLVTLVVLMTVTVLVLLGIVVYFVFWRWTSTHKVKGDAGHWMDAAIRRQAIVEAVWGDSIDDIIEMQAAGGGKPRRSSKRSSERSKRRNRNGRDGRDGSDGSSDGSSGGSDDGATGRSDIAIELASDGEERAVLGRGLFGSSVGAAPLFSPRGTRKGFGDEGFDASRAGSGGAPRLGPDPAAIARVREFANPDDDSIDEAFAAVFPEDGPDGGVAGSGEQGKLEAWEIDNTVFRNEGDGVLFDSDAGPLLDAIGLSGPPQYDKNESHIIADVALAIGGANDHIEGALNRVWDVVTFSGSGINTGPEGAGGGAGGAASGADGGNDASSDDSD
jgi:hypothetical protein